MIRNFTKFKYTKYWNQTTHMCYGTYFPRPPQKPDDDLVMAFLLAGLGTSCGYSMWSDKKPIYSQSEFNSRIITSISTGISFSGAVGYLIKYIRR